MCAHRQPAYALQPWSCTPGLDRCAEGQQCAGLRESVRAEDHAILLPFYSAMTTDEQDLVVSAVAEAVEQLTAAQKARV
jgi:dTDP-4-amino-4,6-dideoxygalactose transaminase